MIHKVTITKCALCPQRDEHFYSTVKYNVEENISDICSCALEPLLKDNKFNGA